MFETTLADLARTSGEILMRHFRNLSGYERKADIDLVTAADKESESYLVGEIRKRHPGHAILAEEGGRIGNAESDWLWVIDPLDGTTNFAHGMRLFAVSIGLLHRGEPLAAAVNAPAMGELYTAVAGGGARCNGAPVHVSPVSALGDALLVTGFPYERKKLIEPLLATVEGALLHSHGLLRLGAASYDMALLASGRLDGFFEYGLKPWDMAAGALLVKEAGGRVSGLLPGEEFDIFKPRLLATNGLIHHELQGMLAEHGGAAFPPIP